MSDYKPITGELRKYVGFDRGMCYMNEDSFNASCDEIDSVHAQLERENAALKAELDRMLGEQEEYAHMSGESITGELRDWSKDRIFMANGWQEINDIADRIDAEHERQLEVLYRDMSDAEYVKLPKDADGEYIHIGDVMENLREDLEPQLHHRFKVYGIQYREYGQECTLTEDGYPSILYRASECRHYHAPTVEDVLREFALKVAGEECMTMRTGVVEEYAKRLKLAGDAS